MERNSRFGTRHREAGKGPARLRLVKLSEVTVGTGEEGEQETPLQLHGVGSFEFQLEREPCGSSRPCLASSK